MISSRLVRPLVVATLALGLLPGMTSASAADSGVLAGFGTISPGVPPSGCASQHVTFDGTLVLAGTNTGVYSVHYDGYSSTCESVSSGAGSGTLSGDVTGTVEYSRIATAVTLSGSVQIEGGTTTQTVAGAACTFVPTSVSPTTSYAMACLLVLV